MNRLTGLLTLDRGVKVGRFLTFGVGLSAAALAAYVLLQAIVVIGVFLYGRMGDDGGARFVRPMHLEMHLRSQVLAVTGLAPNPGPWSTSVDRNGTQVLGKGDARRVIPVPTGMDLPGSPDMLESTVVIASSEEGAVIRVTNVVASCRVLLTRNQMARFTEGPLEYSLTGRAGWKPYDDKFECPEEGYKSLWLRPARTRSEAGGVREGRG